MLLQQLLLHLQLLLFRILLLNRGPMRAACCACPAARALTQMKGYDAAAHVLACFGGAGGQHACAIATALGMRSIFVHKCARTRARLLGGRQHASALRAAAVAGLHAHNNNTP